MSIQQEITLRYNAPGHIRLQIPRDLCHEAAANFLNEAIHNIEGVYRVNLFKNKQKLSIRYIDESLSFQQLMQQLLDLIIDAEAKGTFKEQNIPSKAGSLLKNTLSNWRGTSWAKEKYTETKETAQAVGVLAKFGLKKKDILEHPDKYLIPFFNDILLLFLIKTHWKLITKKWLLAPLKYRYNWMAVFYLMYLFIRAKSVKSK